MPEILAVSLKLGRSDDMSLRPGAFTLWSRGNAVVAYGLGYLLCARLASWRVARLKRLSLLTVCLANRKLATRRPISSSGLQTEPASGRRRRAGVLKAFPCGIRQRIRGNVRRTTLCLPVPMYDLVSASLVNKFTKVRSEFPWW